MVSDADVKRLIDDTVSETLIKLKKLGLMKEGKKSAYNKTEELLRNYPEWKNMDGELTKKLIGILDEELKKLEDDPYYDIIPMSYFENATYEDIAEYFDVSTRTVMRNKIRLINKLKVVLFSDDVITEIFL